MSRYLVPCECGKQTTVTTSQAGQTVLCDCGARLEVPTLRGLQELSPADIETHAARLAGVWENRQRLSFAFLVVSVFAFCIAGYLYAILPPFIPPPTDEQVDVAVDSMPPEMLGALFAELQKGIAHDDPQAVALSNMLTGQRDAKLLGMQIALAIGGCSLVAAAIASLVPRGQRR